MKERRKQKNDFGYIAVIFLSLVVAAVFFGVQGLDVPWLQKVEEEADPGEDGEMGLNNGNNGKDENGTNEGNVGNVGENSNLDSSLTKNDNEDKKESGEESTSEAESAIATFAQQHSLNLSDWPEELIELLKANPDATDFVLNYPLKKDVKYTINLSEYRNCSSVPLLFQWDERWGYSEYGDNVMGLTGCGPTCLSMVCIYLLEDTKYDPRYIADFSVENGYCVPGSGSAWTLISKGGEKLGLDVTEIPLDENRIIRNLEVGNLIICIMGPGDFTTTGHFIVMTEYVDGKIKVNDPNSKERSEILWEYDDIKNQIRNLWVCR